MSNERKTFLALGLQSDRVSRVPLCDQNKLLQHIHKLYIINGLSHKTFLKSCCCLNVVV